MRPHPTKDAASIGFITYNSLLETHFHFDEFKVLSIAEVVIDAAESYHILALVSVDLVSFLVERQCLTIERKYLSLFGSVEIGCVSNLLAQLVVLLYSLVEVHTTHVTQCESKVGVHLECFVEAVDSTGDVALSLEELTLNVPQFGVFGVVSYNGIGKDSIYMSSFLGLVNDEVLSDGVNEISVYNGMSVRESDFNQYFEDDDIVYVRFSTMDEASWRYWDAFEEIQSLSRNPFFPVSNAIKSNVTGGLGYWAGYGSTYYRLPISAPDEKE